MVYYSIVPINKEEAKMTTIKNQNFGIEIELTGITRAQGAKIISQYFGNTETDHLYDGYDSWTAKDSKGRTWKCMRDVSIKPQVKEGLRVEDRPEGRPPWTWSSPGRI